VADLPRDAEIQIEIRPDGTVHFEVSGIPGDGCEAVERLLLEALRGEVVERERTSEFWQQQQSSGASVGDRLKAWLGRK